MLVKFFKLTGEEIATKFPLGTHVVGRGPSLECNDKRVSRNHATLEITPNDVRLTSTHVNPCFLRDANSKTITILKKDSTTKLHDGDLFAFLPEDYWYRIKIIKEYIASFEENANEDKLKRSFSCSEDEPQPDKKIKLDENHEENDVAKDLTAEATPECDESRDVDTFDLNVTETSGENGEREVKEEIEENKDAEIKDEENWDPEIKEEIEEKKDDVEIEEVEEIESEERVENQNKDEPPKNENSTNGDENPGPSNPRPRRERCWYGAKCYRKNPVHRQDFTHPGDSDFESDPEDDRPICPYGAACYRKNKDHRRNYKHPPGQSPSKKKRERKKVKRPGLADSEELRDLGESDEDPFIVSDDSGEYEADSYDEDSDWEDSQNNEDEDSENVKRLVKEAKKFVKK